MESSLTLPRPTPAGSKAVSSVLSSQRQPYPRVRIAAEQDDRFVGRRAIGGPLPGHFMHPDVFVPEHPLKRDVVRRSLAPSASRSRSPAGDSGSHSATRDQRERARWTLTLGTSG